ncbi:hypothetical protein [Bordetella flabilis]|uniref:SCP2 domain-containing protein n=1 Tax=Bordetella flabilis TaxID=463014 RepID=A0A193GCT7_9BORD|nr:hypothetical protein [Bordetella flabilis]ANN77635.1 hypothetical protein BAU07_11430 [Bordetella flabilis]
MHDPSIQPDEDLVRRFTACATGFARARAVDADILVQFGSAPVIVKVRDGAVCSIAAPRAPLPSWDYAVRGSARGWQALWEAPPAPGWHDIFALAKLGEFAIEGRLQGLMAHLQFVKDLLACPRAAGTPGSHA